MKFGTRRVIPLVFLVVSLLYLAFSFSLEQYRMIGDERGWDPGSRALPIAMGFLMLGLSIYLILNETAKEQAEGSVPAGARNLILLTLIMSVLYILVFRTLGFILSTAVLLFTLIYFNYQENVRLRLLPRFAVGLAASAAFGLLIYTAGRFITRGLFFLGRARGYELFTSKVFSAFVVLLAVSALFAGLLVSFRRTVNRSEFRSMLVAGLVSAGVTEGLYLVFKQIFLVNLARGIVFW
ncbi:MAG: tripartite tricarboxylate transporter TctB family protein [Spirochaetaceae bacterium]|nr:MAG: tripartite tricarboxylate transporter TctB family protein [Spirochaetaceae bacterium]